MSKSTKPFPIKLIISVSIAVLILIGGLLVISQIINNTTDNKSKADLIGCANGANSICEGDETCEWNNELTDSDLCVNGKFAGTHLPAGISCDFHCIARNPDGSQYSPAITNATNSQLTSSLNGSSLPCPVDIITSLPSCGRSIQVEGNILGLASGAGKSEVGLKLTYKIRNISNDYITGTLYTITDSAGHFKFSPIWENTMYNVVVSDLKGQSLSEIGMKVRAGLPSDSGKLGWTWRTNDSRDTDTSDSYYDSQVAGRDDCASANSIVASGRCNFTMIYAGGTPTTSTSQESSSMCPRNPTTGLIDCDCKVGGNNSVTCVHATSSTSSSSPLPIGPNVCGDLRCEIGEECEGVEYCSGDRNGPPLPIGSTCQACRIISTSVSSAPSSTCGNNICEAGEMCGDCPSNINEPGMTCVNCRLVINPNPITTAISITTTVANSSISTTMPSTTSSATSSAYKSCTVACSKYDIGSNDNSNDNFDCKVSRIGDFPVWYKEFKAQDPNQLRSDFNRDGRVGIDDYSSLVEAITYYDKTGLCMQ